MKRASSARHLQTCSDMLGDVCRHDFHRHLEPPPGAIVHLHMVQTLSLYQKIASRPVRAQQGSHILARAPCSMQGRCTAEWGVLILSSMTADCGMGSNLMCMEGTLPKPPSPISAPSVSSCGSILGGWAAGGMPK